MADDGFVQHPLAKWFIVPQRFIAAFMGFLSVVVSYALRVSLSLTITVICPPAEVAEQKHGGGSVCEPDPTWSDTKSDSVKAAYETYDWSQRVQTFVLGSFYIGYLISHVPGGLLAENFGSKWTLSLSILFGAIFNCLSPIVITKLGPYPFAALRVAIGLCHGIVYPALSVLIVHWVPMKERGTLGALTMGAGAVGTIVGNTLPGFLLSKFDWPIVFVIFSVLNAAWCIFYLLICYEDPYSHPFISKKERDYLIAEMGPQQVKGKRKTPWLKIFTNIHVLALLCVQCGFDFAFFIFITNLPKYMSDVLRVSTKNNGIFNALPFVFTWITAILTGYMSDFMVSRNWVTLTTSRKIFIGMAAIGPAVFMVAASYAECKILIVVACFILCMTCVGAYYSSQKLSPLDLSPKYAGTLMGIVNGLGSLTGVLAPYFAGLLTPNATMGEWRLVFWITSGLKIGTYLVFLIWGTAEEQSFGEDVPD